jgi:hypothetical protein
MVTVRGRTAVRRFVENEDGFGMPRAYDLLRRDGSCMRASPVSVNLATAPGTRPQRSDRRAERLRRTSAGRHTLGGLSASPPGRRAVPQRRLAALRRPVAARPRPLRRDARGPPVVPRFAAHAHLLAGAGRRGGGLWLGTLGEGSLPSACTNDRRAGEHPRCTSARRAGGRALGRGGPLERHAPRS